MSKVSDEMVDARKRLQEALDAFDADVSYHLTNESERADLWEDIEVNAGDLRQVLAALEAVSSIHEAEPVGWETPAEWELETAAFNAANNRDVPEWARTVIANLWKQYCLVAAPISKGVTVKALIGDSGPHDNGPSDGENGELDAGINYAIERLCEILDVDPKSISWDAATETMDGDVSSVICNVLIAAYGEEWSSKPETTARILACLSHTAGEIEGVYVAVDHTGCIHSSEDKEFIAGIARDTASHAEAADKRIAELTEQAFRDGVAYATNCEVTDVDLAWSQSRVRAALKEQLL